MMIRASTAIVVRWIRLMEMLKLLRKRLWLTVLAWPSFELHENCDVLAGPSYFLNNAVLVFITHGPCFVPQLLYAFLL